MYIQLQYTHLLAELVNMYCITHNNPYIIQYSYLIKPGNLVRAIGRKVDDDEQDKTYLKNKN